MTTRIKKTTSLKLLCNVLLTSLLITVDVNAATPPIQEMLPTPDMQVPAVSTEAAAPAQLPAAAKVKILSTHAAATPDKTRIVFVLNNTVTYHSFYLQNPDRFVIDINNSYLAPDLKTLILNNSPVISVRDAMRNQVDLRIVFDLKSPVPTNVFLIAANNTADNQPRLVVDFTNPTTINPSISNLPPSQPFSAQPSSQTSTQSSDKSVTAENNHSNQQKTSLPMTISVEDKQKDNSKDNKDNSVIAASLNLPLPSFANDAAASIVNNTAKSTSTTTRNTDTTVNVAAAPLPNQQSVILFDTAGKRHKRNILVVIDPGHGGKDPGASGPHGVQEKNVVLAIAQALQTHLNGIPGVHAVLTRNSDYFIGLRQRLDIARLDKADLFVAIHADAYGNPNSQAQGATVFALSERGASSEAARWLAERENYSELGGVQDFSDKSRLVRSVLLDLSQTVTITQSLQIGQVILSSLQQLTPLHHNVVEQARFVVLKSPDIPSLLVETGFITNPIEEMHLNDRSYQDHLAQALSIGIEKYFWRNPPNGSIFTAKKS